jgi:hypothetical protein
VFAVVLGPDLKGPLREKEAQKMSQSDDWSPDEAPDGEAFEQGDEALDEETRLDPDFIEELQGDPSLDPSLQLDEVELKEAGVEFDDPDDQGWELDDAITGTPATEEG